MAGPANVESIEHLSRPQSQSERLALMAERMKRTGQWSQRQAAGRRWAIGCVSLEITQRCNLDCTLCYLSDSAEVIKDVPIEELFRRIDQIAVQFGPNTDVQISGGDPTLRDRAELSQIVRYVRSRGLRASLFTNGILLDRAWLEELAKDGLNDVAFHVDLTQQRKGYGSELELNVLRLKYIEMARGLPLSVIFNTTVYADNLPELPALVNFFIHQNDVVRFASFQLAAATGRGTVNGRDPVLVTQASVRAAIERGAGIELNFDALHGGHQLCNRYAVLVSVGEQRFDLLANSALVARVMRETADVVLDRDQGTNGAKALLRALARKPGLWRGALQETVSVLWRSRRQWWRGGIQVPPVRKISFFMHNFMDACSLDKERIDACIFMAATVDGPLSMCAYNAQRDNLLLKPIRLKSGETWLPIAAAANQRGEVQIPLKWLKGRLRAESARSGFYSN